MSIEYQVDQGVATLTLNRPEKKNARCTRLSPRT
jgi:enoyl-CoA hydratase/carnithine racemase